jgi:hypothetical protein
MSIKQRAIATERMLGNIRSDGGSSCHLVSMAIYLRVRTQAPPPVAEYEAWYQENAAARGKRRVGCAGSAQMDGSKLRRAVVLIRNGHSLNSAGKILRHSAPALKGWLDRLPPELAA